MAVTQKQIDKAIEECEWKVTIGERGVCRGHTLPCTSVIESGQCSALIELFRNEGKEE